MSLKAKYADLVEKYGPGRVYCEPQEHQAKYLIIYESEKHGKILIDIQSQVEMMNDLLGPFGAPRED